VPVDRTEGETVRKFGVLIAALSLTVALTACGDDGGSDEGGGDGGFEPVNEDVLTVVTSLPAPGFWDGEDPADITGGFEYDMAVEMADRLGLDGVEVMNVSFDALVAGQVTDFDIALSQVTITDERAEVVDFTDGYFTSDQGILVLADSGVEVNDLEDAQSIQWGVQTATTAQTFLADEVEPDSEPLSYRQTTQAFNALQAGQIDAVLLDTAIVVEQASQPDSDFEVIGQFRTGEEYGGILEKGSPNLESFNDLIQDMLDDGTIDDLIQENLVPNIVPEDVPVVEI
jgi:polar amino acid transport system substrate-binding protein